MGSGWFVAYRDAVALDSGPGDCGAGEKDEVARGGAWASDGGPRAGMGATSGGWVILGVGASGNSSSQCLGNITGAASVGGAYRAEERIDGGRGRGACKSESGA